MSKGYDFWKRLVTGFIFICLLWYWYSGMVLHHVWDSPFTYKGADISFWFVEWTHLPRFILQSENSALLFDFLLLGSFIASFVLVKQRAWIYMSGILLVLYQILFNYKLGYHTHHLYGLQFALLPFYFKKEMFEDTWPFARLMAVLTYFFAGLFKLIGRGWEPSSFAHTLENQHAAHFHFNPIGPRSDFAHWMIQHESIAFLFYLAAMLLQLSFILALFTRRFDLVFAAFIFLFHAMDWFLMNLGVFMSMTVLIYLFLLRSHDFKGDKITQQPLKDKEG